MAIGNIGGLGITGRRSAEHEDFIVKGTGAEQQFPMDRTSGHVESRRDDDKVGSVLSHFPGQFWETKVIAYFYTNFTPGCLKQSCGITRGQHQRFSELYTIFDSYIKQVGFAVLGNNLPLWIKYDTCIVEQLTRQFWNRAANEKKTMGAS